MAEKVSAHELLQLLHSQVNADKHILYTHMVAPTPAVFAEGRDVPLGIFPHLYSHQHATLETAQRGENVVLATPAASGKTFATALPYLLDAQADPTICLLCLAPQRPLVEQWRDRLQAWCPGKSVQAFTSDTPKSERASIRRNAHIIVSTPDMLHVSMIPFHEGWRSFYERLRYVLIDESHVFRGFFGSNMAHVLHRFERILDHYQSTRPMYLFATATIGNPQEHTEKLLRHSVQAMTQNGAPSGGCVFVLWQPSNKRLHSDEAAHLMAFFLKRGIRTILFGQQRQSVERIQQQVQQRLPADRRAQVVAYRSGYLSAHRKKLQSDLVSGKLLGVVSTTVLELGIDIGGLDVVIMDGFPGSVSSLWQQAGRAGRTQKPALVILVLRENALDQHFASHPQRLFDAPLEHAYLNTHNPYILQAHLHCAARDLPPLTKEDVESFGRDAVEAAEDLVRQGFFVKDGNTYYLQNAKSTPAHSVSLRNFGQTLVVVDEANQTLEEPMNLPQAVMECYPGAIYYSSGTPYRVDRLDLAEQRIVMRRCDVNYYTEPLVQIDITILKTYPETTDLPHAQVSMGEVEVKRTVEGFRCKDNLTHAILRTETLKEPLPLSLRTQACWLKVGETLMQEAMSQRHHPLGSLHAIEHTLMSILPLFVLGDSRDMGGLSLYPKHQQTQEATIFLYDEFPGGIGYALEAFHLFQKLARTALETISQCPCEAGCYACIQAAQCRSQNKLLDKAGAIFVLQELTRDSL